MASTDLKKIILNKVNEVLKPRHFKKSGTHFKFSNGDLTYYIGLQSSTVSTSKILKATFNIGIASELLHKLQGKVITSHLQGHYIKRIGDYLEEPNDKWWTIESLALANIAADEIAMIITKNVIPEFDSITKTEDLIKIWLAQASENNVEIQEYLVLLYKSQTVKPANSGM